MKESLYYTKLDNNTVECTLCPHNCKLKDGHYGICNSRLNVDGVLYATSYGNICSVGIDPIEKKPICNFLPGTLTYSISSAGCNLRCLQCQNDGISQFKPNDRTGWRMTPKSIVEKAIEAGCQSISYTYTEPTTFYEMMIETSIIGVENGLKNVMVSNGYINRKPLEQLCETVHAFNIDLKYFSNETYKRVSKGSLEPVLECLKVIKEKNRWLEITNLIIPGINDDLNEIEQMCKWLVENGFGEYPLHFNRFYPRYQMIDVPWTPVDRLYDAKRVAEQVGIQIVYLGNI